MAIKTNKAARKIQRKQNNHPHDQLVGGIPVNEYDRLFEQKLSEQYRMFRNLKEHHMQTRKFVRIVVILLVIVLLSILLISYA